MADEVNCPDCGKAYESWSGVKYHLKTDTNTCSGIECDKCGADHFYKKDGLEYHYAREHGESITSVEVTCGTCGDVFEKCRAKAKRSESHYCCRDCHASDKGIDMMCTCEMCGSEFQIRPANEDRRRTCSNECQAELFAEMYGGKSSPVWKGGGVDLECEICGEQFNAIQSNVENRKTCSRSCRKEYLSREYSGEDSHEWKGGAVGYYGPNWRKNRRKAIKRDGNECRVCGTTSEEVGRELDVHHITPIREFKDNHEPEDAYELANDLDNLVTVCRPCHIKWEGIPIFPTS